MKRCAWVNDDQIYIDYHDNEWGKPLKDDLKLFELFILEGFQAGLSWITILKKRENFRRAFDGFNPHKILNYDQKKIDELKEDASIIRNRLKIEAAIKNAIAYFKVIEEFGSFSTYLWSFVNNETIINQYKLLKDVPTSTDESLAMSKDLKKRGFKFCGPTICYAFMEAAGLVNDHTEECFLFPKK